jgi:hypothetical protein
MPCECGSSGDESPRPRHPVGDLVQAYPQSEIGRLQPQLAFDRDDVGVDQQQAAAVVERVVLAENPRCDEGQYGTGLRAGEPSADHAPRLVGSAGHHPHRLGGRPDPAGPVDDTGVGNHAVGVQTGYVTHRRFSRLGGGSQVVDHLVAGVVGGRRARTGQPLADRRRESPIDSAPHGQLR